MTSRARSNSFKESSLQKRRHSRIKAGYYDVFREYNRSKRPPESVETIMARIDAKVAREMKQVLKELGLLEES